MIIRKQSVPWKFWWPVMHNLFCESEGGPIDRSCLLLWNNSSVLQILYFPLFGFLVLSLAVLGCQTPSQRLSTILVLILIPLAQAWYNFNCNSNIPLHNSFPCWILWGTFPLDPCIVCLINYNYTYQICFSSVPAGVTSSSSQSYFISIIIERMFCLFLFIWPKAVTGVIFKCLFIAFSVRPGQILRWPFFFINFRRDDFLGLNSALCK